MKCKYVLNNKKKTKKRNPKALFFPYPYVYPNLLKHKNDKISIKN